MKHMISSPSYCPYWLDNPACKLTRCTSTGYVYMYYLVPEIHTPAYYQVYMYMYLVHFVLVLVLVRTWYMHMYM